MVQIAAADRRPTGSVVIQLLPKPSNKLCAVPGGTYERNLMSYRYTAFYVLHDLPHRADTEGLAVGHHGPTWRPMAEMHTRPIGVIRTCRNDNFGSSLLPAPACSACICPVSVGRACFLTAQRPSDGPVDERVLPNNDNADRHFLHAHALTVLVRFRIISHCQTHHSALSLYVTMPS